MSTKILAMKTTTRTHINPINRDLAILIFTGLLVAVTLVTVGIILVNQL